MSLKQIFIIILCFVLTIVLILTISHLSLWFLWALLPQGEIKLAVNQSSQVITDPLISLLPPQIKDIIPTSTLSSKFALSKSDKKTTLLAIPSNPFLFSSHKALTSYFNNKGWNSYHFGLIIVAHPNGNQKLNHLSGAWFRSINELIKLDRPIYPLIIIEATPGSISFIDESIALIGYIKQGDTINVLTASAENEISQNNITRQTQQGEVNELQIAINSQSLNLLPAEMRQQWDSFYAESFGFYKTKPNLTRSLLQHETIYLSVQNNSPIIAISGNPLKFINTIKEWVQVEEAYSRPQKRAFRLPDKTLGYEQVPGDSRDVFKYDDNQCQHASWPAPQGFSGVKPKDDMLHLWLCKNNNQVALAQSKEAALETANQLIVSDGQWRLYLGPQYAPPLSNQLLNSLSVIGNDTYSLIQLQLSTSLSFQ
jgi:hypothetical protein